MIPTAKDHLGRTHKEIVDHYKDMGFPNYTDDMEKYSRAHCMARVRYVLDNAIGAENMIDLGCHTGYCLFTCMRKLKLKHGVGVDINQQAIEQARKVRKYYSDMNIDFCREDLFEFKTDEKFDVVVCYETIEHYPDELALIDAVEQHAKPGGKIFFSTPDKLSIYGGEPDEEHVNIFHREKWNETFKWKRNFKTAKLGDLFVGCYDV